MLLLRCLGFVGGGFSFFYQNSAESYFTHISTAWLRSNLGALLPPAQTCQQ